MTEAEEEKLIADVKDFLERVGGKCGAMNIKTIFGKKADEDWLRSHPKVFFFKDIHRARRSDVIVELVRAEPKVVHDMEHVCERVAKRLVRLGGSADLHDTTRRFSVSKQNLMQYGGQLFEISDGKIMLSGGLRAVAQAAIAAGTAPKHLPGTQKPGKMLTSQGVAVDKRAGELLLQRIEAYLTSEGDGIMPVKCVYDAFGLQPTCALRRWFKRAGLIMKANGSLEVDKWRITYFRLRRALAVASLLSRNGGSADLQDVIDLVHQPPKFSRPRQISGGGKDERKKLSSPASGGKAVKGLLMGDAEERSAKTTRGGASYLRNTEPEEPSGSRAIVRAETPIWIPVWVRRYFNVAGDKVYFPAEPRPYVRPPTGPDDAEPFSLEDEKWNIMKIEEEMRMRYNRAHVTALAGMFPGVKQSMFQRFYDVSRYGDVLPKSAHRQVCEALAIARHIHSIRAAAAAAAEDVDNFWTDFGMVDVEAPTASAYLLDDAFRDYGMPATWIKRYFLVDEATGALALDEDEDRAWDPPEKPTFVDPFSYTKLEAPAYYNTKGNLKYAKSKWVHNAIGILY